MKPPISRDEAIGLLVGLLHRRGYSVESINRDEELVEVKFQEEGNHFLSLSWYDRTVRSGATEKQAYVEAANDLIDTALSIDTENLAAKVSDTPDQLKQRIYPVVAMGPQPGVDIASRVIVPHPVHSERAVLRVNYGVDSPNIIQWLPLVYMEQLGLGLEEIHKLAAENWTQAFGSIKAQPLKPESLYLLVAGHYYASAACLFLRDVVEHDAPGGYIFAAPERETCVVLPLTDGFSLSNVLNMSIVAEQQWMIAKNQALNLPFWTDGDGTFEPVLALGGGEGELPSVMFGPTASEYLLERGISPETG